MNILVTKNCPFLKKGKEILSLLIPNLHPEDRRDFLSAVWEKNPRCNFNRSIAAPLFWDDCT
jgi:hypothetical protein